MELVRQIVYTTFINKNHVLFHLQLKKKVIIYEKILKILWLPLSVKHILCPYWQLQMSKAVIIRLKSTLPFNRNVIHQTCKFFNTKFEPQWNVIIKKNKFWHCFTIQLLQFFVKNMMKPLKLKTQWKDSILRKPGASYKQKSIFRENHKQNFKRQTLYFL